MDENLNVVNDLVRFRKLKIRVSGVQCLPGHQNQRLTRGWDFGVEYKSPGLGHSALYNAEINLIKIKQLN